MAIKRIHPYVETDDLDASRSFYTDIFGLQVAMETPMLCLQAPDPPIRAGHRLPPRLRDPAARLRDRRRRPRSR